MSLRHFVSVKNFLLYMYILYNGDIGQLVFFFAGVCPLEAKRFEIGGVSFRVISSPMNAGLRDRRTGSPDQNWPV